MSEESPQSLGGKARAQKLTHNEKVAIARQGAIREMMYCLMLRSIRLLCKAARLLRNNKDSRKNVCWSG